MRKHTVVGLAALCCCEQQQSLVLTPCLDLFQFGVLLIIFDFVQYLNYMGFLVQTIIVGA